MPGDISLIAMQLLPLRGGIAGAWAAHGKSGS
jgi:hypothetical protein